MNDIVPINALLRLGGRFTPPVGAVVLMDPSPLGSPRHVRVDRVYKSCGLTFVNGMRVEEHLGRWHCFSTMSLTYPLEELVEVSFLPVREKEDGR